MLVHRKLITLTCLFLLPIFVFAQRKHKKSYQPKHIPTVTAGAASSFRIVPLGVLGGIDESNLSAYMVAPAGSDNYACLDAGTLHAGIEKAIKENAFDARSEKVLKQYIKGYFISHAHLDHIAGLIINSPEDSTKNIYGLASTLETVKTHYFTWESWANFADDGGNPQLRKYHYSVLQPGVETPVDNTEMQVQAFPLSHSNLTSTAFLLRSKDSYVLYLGDTGADEKEKSQNLHKLWEAVAPLVAAGKLKALMIEVSYANEQPDKSLFGHLTPRLLMNELDVLAQLSGTSLKGLNVVITHLKPPYKTITKIKTQLNYLNTKREMNLVYPRQGKPLGF
ncbi:3',5'-cyclic-nucleotide phosphodiesterase [Mucilaginibacter sp. ZT4R22]|uniref:3',5'-cyclic-nucleotide phosphodiesterase n=1 Tax=Mucilaginibacter pankratovii TaxID=2772110 RepID=A0ABR7WPH5_9SPHI|nr:3',5'-cyclic-nucleotide phosphodiesterase [Mucilaginibacter pankratovii]MBD1364068.1 3',5'-cyclic-nucleotide phosphodiesterase [Mucilaginibacter pankratovii]